MADFTRSLSAEHRAQARFHPRLLRPQTGRDLVLGGLDVTQNFDLVEQALVRFDAEQHRCAPSMLGEDHGLSR